MHNVIGGVPWTPARHSARPGCLHSAKGVQWKQGVVICMVLYTILLYNPAPIHCTPLPLHPPVMNTQAGQRRTGRHPEGTEPRRPREWGHTWQVLSLIVLLSGFLTSSSPHLDWCLKPPLSSPEGTGTACRGRHRKAQAVKRPIAQSLPMTQSLPITYG